MKNKLFHAFSDKQLTDILNEEEVIALQKISKGHANEYEQKLGYKIIIEKLCRINAPSFHENQNIANFNEGVRWVGLLLSFAHVADTDKFKKNNPIKSNINNQK